MQRLKINPDFLQTRIQSIKIDNDDLDLLDEVDMYFLHPVDYEADIFDCYWLKSLDEFIPYKLVNRIIERLNTIRRFGLSEYAEFRACEDFVLKTDWFTELESSSKQCIREDFYGTVIVGIRNAFDRKRSWQLK